MPDLELMAAGVDDAFDELLDVAAKAKVKAAN